MSCGTHGCPTPETCKRVGCTGAGKNSAVKPYMNAGRQMPVGSRKKPTKIPVKKV